MNAKLLLRLACLVAGLALAASLASAQATTRPSGGAAGEHERVGKLREALAQLDLSANQKQQIEQVFADVKAKIKALRGGSNGKGSGEMKSQVRQILEDAHQRIVGLLTDPQKEKLRELMQGAAKNRAAATKSSN